MVDIPCDCSSFSEYYSTILMIGVILYLERCKLKKGKYYEWVEKNAEKNILCQIIYLP